MSTVEEYEDEERRKFLNEVITLTLKKSKAAACATWKVSRFRLDVDFVNNLIQRSFSPATGVTLAYLKTLQEKGKKGSHGGIILPQDMVRLCRKNEVYEIVIKEPKTIEMPSQSTYKGGVKFLLRNVPSFSQNNLYPVRIEHLVHWIKESILKEEPKLKEMLLKIETLKKSLSKVTSKLEELCSSPIVDSKGDVIVGKEAERIRSQNYNRILQDRLDLRSDLEEANNSKSKLYQQQYKELEVIVKECKVGEFSVTFCGFKKEYYEDVFKSKSDWNTTLLFASPENVDLAKDNEQDSEYLVNTGEMSICCVEHGFGCFQKSNDESNVHSSAICYLGTYEDGLFHGSGLLYDSDCIYAGSFNRGKKSADGMLLTKDGDVLRGDFAAVESKPVHKNNRYAKGLMSGKGTISFADGAIFEGELRNGNITGNGIYISSKGDKLEGAFLNGELVEGTKALSTGETFQGAFSEFDLLEGIAHYSSQEKRSKFQGNFSGGMKEGYGLEVFHSKHKTEEVMFRFEGTFECDRRSGLGVQRISVDRKPVIIRGPWLTGRVKTRGHFSSNSASCTPTSSKQSTQYKLLHRFAQVEMKKEKKLESERISLSSEEGKTRLARESHCFDAFCYYTNKNNKELGEREMKLPSKAPLKQHMTVMGPRTVESAQHSPGLQLLPEILSSQGIYHEMKKKLLKEWNSDNVEIFKEYIDSIDFALNLLEEDIQFSQKNMI